MILNIEGYEDRISSAVKKFWQVRETKTTQSGKTLDGFVDVLDWIVHSNGLPNAQIIKGTKAVIPGYFRPTKNWDYLVFNDNKVIASIELKSIADSFGKNSNNRAEEALGSGIDIKEALAEDAFENVTRLFSGYLILIEDCEATDKEVAIQMRHFRAMEDFLSEPQNRDEIYVKNSKGEYPFRVPEISYRQRFDVMCKRLMRKSLYTSACVITTPRSAKETGEFGEVSEDTSVKRFLADFASYIQSVAI